MIIQFSWKTHDFGISFQKQYSSHIIFTIARLWPEFEAYSSVRGGGDQYTDHCTTFGAKKSRTLLGRFIDLVRN